MKPHKVLCCTFLLSTLGVDLAQNLAKYKRWLCVLKQLVSSRLVPMDLSYPNDSYSLSISSYPTL